MGREKKVGIALEGGGAKGAYQIGVLKAIQELDIKYDCVTGTSIGAINSIGYVLGDYDRFHDIWCNVNFSYRGSNENSDGKSFDFNKILNNIDKFEKIYLNSNGIDSENIIKMFKENFDEDAIRNSKIELGITTYCLTDRKPLSLFIGEIPKGQLAEFIFASSNIPVFTPRPIDGKYYLDGTMVSKLPIDMIAQKGYDTIIAVRLRPDKYDFSKYKGINIIDIAPEEFLSSTLEASQDRINWMIEKGYMDAAKILNQNISYLK